jgi:hypothetical protein
LAIFVLQVRQYVCRDHIDRQWRGAQRCLHDAPPVPESNIANFAIKLVRLERFCCKQEQFSK